LASSQKYFYTIFKYISNTFKNTHLKLLKADFHALTLRCFVPRLRAIRWLVKPLVKLTSHIDNYAYESMWVGPKVEAVIGIPQVSHDGHTTCC